MQADHAVRGIMTPNVLQSLEQIPCQMLNIIATEVNTYEPWFTPDEMDTGLVLCNQNPMAVVGKTR